VVGIDGERPIPGGDGAIQILALERGDTVPIIAVAHARLCGRKQHLRAVVHRRKRDGKLERLQRESTQIMAQARAEAESMLARSRSDAEALREELKQKARTEAAAIVKNAERQIQLETARAVQQIRHEAVDLSVAIASKILRRQVTREDNEALIQEALKQVESQPTV